MTLDVGATHTVTAAVLDGDGKPAVGELVTFAVTGANTATGTATTDVNGRATFTYTGTAPGTDTISASFDDDGDIRVATAEAVWEINNLAPNCTTATASRTIWRPNHKMVPVTIDGITVRPEPISGHPSAGLLPGRWTEEFSIVSRGAVSSVREVRCQ